MTGRESLLFDERTDDRPQGLPVLLSRKYAQRTAYQMSCSTCSVKNWLHMLEPVISCDFHVSFS